MEKSTNINVSDSELKDLIKLYKSKIKDLEKQLAEAKTTLASLTDRQGKVGHVIIDTPLKYDVDWTLAKKAAYFLNKSQKVRTTKELFQRIMLTDQFSKRIYTDSRKLMVNLSATLNSYSSKNLVFRKIKYKGDNTVYFALREWLINEELPKKYWSE